MLNPIYSLNTRFDAIPEDSRFFKAMTVVPIVGTFFELWKTQRLFRKFRNEWVVPPNASIFEKKAVYQRVLQKAEPLAVFITNVVAKNPLLNMALHIYTIVMIAVFLNITVLYPVYAVFKFVQVIQLTYINETLKDLVNELKPFELQCRTLAAPVQTLIRARTQHMST